MPTNLPDSIQQRSENRMLERSGPIEALLTQEAVKNLANSVPSPELKVATHTPISPKAAAERGGGNQMSQ